MTTFIVTALQIIAVMLAADLAAGFVHWIEDAYVREDTPLIGRRVGRPNIIHHHLPRYMTRFTWLETSWDLLLVSGALVLGAWACGCLTWQVWLFAFVSANANEVHKWSHRSRAENGRVIAFLQDIRVLQTPQHHAVHHTNPKEVHYCPVTNWLNPVLDVTHFWEGLEWLLARTIGLKRRPDTSVPHNGLAPAWLEDVRRESARPVSDSGRTRILGRYVGTGLLTMKLIKALRA